MPATKPHEVEPHVEELRAEVAGRELGGATLGPLEEAFVDRASLPTTRELRRVDGVLGNGVLRGYRAWIDLSAHRLALGSPQPGDDPSPADG